MRDVLLKFWRAITARDQSSSGSSDLRQMIEESTGTRPWLESYHVDAFGFGRLTSGCESGLAHGAWRSPFVAGLGEAHSADELVMLNDMLLLHEPRPTQNWITAGDMFSLYDPSVPRNKVWLVDNLLLTNLTQKAFNIFPAGPIGSGPQELADLRESDVKKVFTYTDRYFIRAFSTAEPSAATAAVRVGRKAAPPTAEERLRAILNCAELEPTENGDESPFEHEIALYVTKYGSAALTAIYRALFESDEIPADLGAALLEALALLPKRIEFNGRSSIFRASLRHSEAVIRFVAARALARLRGPGSLDAIRAAGEREKHPDLIRNLTEILKVLNAAAAA